MSCQLDFFFLGNTKRYIDGGHKIRELLSLLVIGGQLDSKDYLLFIGIFGLNITNRVSSPILNSLTML